MTSTQLITSQPGICDGEPAGERIADRGRRRRRRTASRSPADERAAALAQRKRDHQRGAGDGGDPEQRPRPLMGDGDGDQRGGDRQHAQHHAAMRSIDPSASPSDIRSGNRMATQSIAIASCGHSARGGSGRRSTISSTSEHSPAIAVRSAGQCNRIDSRDRDPRRRQRAAEDRHADKAQQQTETFARDDEGEVMTRLVSGFAARAYSNLLGAHGGHAQLPRSNAAPHQSDAGQKQQRQHDVVEIPVVQGVVGRACRGGRRSACRASPAAPAGRRSASTKPVATCRHQRGAEHGAVEDLENAAALILVQPRMLAHRVGSGPDRPARPPRMPPANPTPASAMRPPKRKAIGCADEIERGRKPQQHHADAELETLAGRRARPAARRSACRRVRRPRTARASLKSMQLPHRRQCRDLRTDRADQHQRHGNRGRQDVKPDPQRHQRRAETGKTRHETACERAGKQNRVGGQVHHCLLFLIIARRLHDAADRYYRN